MKRNFVTKASGEVVPFDPDKLYLSMTRAGAGQETARDIIKEVKKALYKGISTRKIYSLAFNLLKKKSKLIASRYKLKRAIMELGPSGFPFEKFVAALFRYHGYVAQTGLILQGRCVSHEVDVIAQKANRYVMAECKFHNFQGINCDVKIPLYIRSRFTDLMEQWNTLPEHKSFTHQAFLITNTRFTDDAIRYGHCVGLKLIGWDFPAGYSLRELIDYAQIYPLTALTSLTSSEKQSLLERGVVLCHDLTEKPGLLSAIGIHTDRCNRIISECSALTSDSKEFQQEIHIDNF